MSVAVAVKKGNQIVLATDGQTHFGSLRVGTENCPTRKIRKIGSSLLATTGWGLYDNILDDFLARGKAPSLMRRQSIFSFFVKFWKKLHDQYPFVKDKCDEDDDSPFADLDSSFLVVNRNGIFYVASDMSVTQFDTYFAIGAGADFALGALHALYDGTLDAEGLARKAVEAAIEFNTYCGGHIQVEKIRAAKGK